MKELQLLDSEISACRKCDRLVEWRETVAREKRASFATETYWGRGVPGFGDPKAKLMVVGLAPAAHGANRTGRMFTGDRSGEWLYRALFRAGFANQPESINIDDGLALIGTWVTSPVKCAPPANSPTANEIATCRPFFVRELDLLEPTVMVALGGIGFTSVIRHFDIRPRPKFGHGVEIHVSDQTTLLGCYHVSQQNTFTGRLTEEMLDNVFARAAELVNQ